MRHPRFGRSWPLLALLAGGCATHPPGDCPSFERAHAVTDYATHYDFSEFRSRWLAGDFKPSGTTPASAPLYHLEVEGETVTTCTQLWLRKRLYLQRANAVELVIEETREIYAANGRLIATRKEDLSAQLRTPGHYSTRVPLPIPAATPPGSYRIVTRLSYKTRAHAKPVTLAQASARFTVVTPRR
jgi:hypothetical protein